MKYYHGTTESFSVVQANSWLTAISTHALAQAEKRAREQGGSVFVLIVEADESDVREANETDRNEENRSNDFAAEGWSVKSTRDLRVLESLDGEQAKERFCGAKNLLPPP
jgi:hypothetical protein